MPTFDLQGIIVPLITPFTRAGEIYEEGLRHLLDFHLEKGSHGMFICGTFGSGPIMSTTERKRVTEITVDQINGRIPVIVQIGSPSTAKVLDLARHAQDTGANAVASTPPFYYKHDEQTVAQHFQELVKAVNIPVFFYNNPGITGFTLRPHFLVKLVELGVQGMKDSGFSFVEFTHNLNALEDRPDFIYVVGTETVCLPAMLLGVKACISGLSNILPELVIDLFNTIRAKNYEEAAKLQIKVNQARRALHIPHSPHAAVYSVLTWRGLDVGVPKRPILPVSRDDEDRMKEAYEKLGLL